MTLGKMLDHRALRWIRQILARLYRRVIPVPLSAEQLDFVERNAAFWRPYFKEDRAKNSIGYVLVNVGGVPVTRLSDASFASIVAHAKNLKLLFVNDLPNNSVSTRILKSYPTAAFSIQYFD